MFDCLFAIFFIVLFGTTLYNYAKQGQRVYAKIDGVDSIDGITYLIENKNVKQVMDKLSSECISNVIKYTLFNPINENEGDLTFGGIAYDLINRGGDMDMGATYRIKCTEKTGCVIMKVSYVGKEISWQYLWTKRPPTYVMNQAYHRFFKEQFNVKIIRDTTM